MDVWSVGCIFAELLSRKILFQAQSPVQQVEHSQSLLSLVIAFSFTFFLCCIAQCKWLIEKTPWCFFNTDEGRLNWRVPVINILEYPFHLIVTLAMLQLKILRFLKKKILMCFLSFLLIYF